ncbi:MAG: serine hydrolase [Pseudomonadota bacterium]
MLNTRPFGLAVCGVVAWISASLPNAAAADVSIGNTFALNQVLNEFVERGDYPFVYARIESFEGRVLYEYSTKNELLLPDADIDGQTWIRIWSMSKIVTITLTMDLVEDGIISLDDPVTDYLPELRGLTVASGPDNVRLSSLPENAEPCPLSTGPAASPITLRNLINHTAGFHYAVTGIECLDSLSSAQNLPGTEDADEFLDRLSALPLVHEPGADYFYGLNTTVLGMALERATRSSLQELVEERITKPLRIRGLQYSLPDQASLLPYFTGVSGTAEVTTPETLNIFGGELPRYDRRNELLLGGEGMLATADGYADFLRMLGNGGMLRGHRVLDDTSLSEMASPQTLINNPAGYNGYNLWVTNGSAPDGQENLWLGGGYESTHFWIDRENEFVGVIMSQMHEPPAAEVSRDEAFRAAVYENLVR